MKTVDRNSTKGFNVEQYKYDYYLNLVVSLWNTWRDNKVILYIVVFF
jgi:hypothetical protein